MLLNTAFYSSEYEYPLLIDNKLQNIQIGELVIFDETAHNKEQNIKFDAMLIQKYTFKTRKENDEYDYYKAVSFVPLLSYV